MKRWLRNLLRSKRKDKVAPVLDTKATNDIEPSTEIDFYIADSPITDPALDRFSRWPFAQRIAQTIASRRDPSSIVIGIYGAWGEGKTTALNFVEKELEKLPQVIPVRFNPWRFGDEDHLLRDFFQSLADALGRSISSHTERIGKWLEQYTVILAPLSVSAGLVKYSPGKLAKTLSSVTLDELRSRIEETLRDEGKRVVILMDDIDRLDKAEIQNVFRLVKLSADFAYTAYILAFDDEMVAAALEEKYASGNEGAGRSFLEKIIQVPLRLPTADPLSLRQLCFEGVDRALGEAGIQLAEGQVQGFARCFVDGLEMRLQTPRMCKHYANALVFSLPILKGEVNPVDLMLIEGMRVFYPKLYEVVRGNPEIFLGQPANLYRTDERENTHAIEIIDGGLEGLTSGESEAARRLLRVLFPRLGGVFGNTGYGAEWDNTWTEEQRIASRHYFSRFFSYAVPEGDFSDQELASFIHRAGTETIENIASEIQALDGDRIIGTFVFKLRRRAGKFSPEVSRRLALALARSGSNFPNPETMFFEATFSQAGMLVGQLVRNIPEAEDRLDIAGLIALEGAPISFALECFRWMRATREEDRAFSTEDENLLGRILATRIKETAQEQPIHIQLPRDTPRLLSVWARWGSREDTNQYLARILDKDPHNALELLKCYLPTALGIGSGLSHKGDLERDQYKSIVQVIDADLVYNALYAVYGSELDSPEYDRFVHESLDERVAHQFAYVYHSIRTEEQKSKDEEESPEGDAAGSQATEDDTEH